MGQLTARFCSLARSLPAQAVAIIFLAEVIGENGAAVGLAATGACCFADSTCTPGMDWANCIFAGGTYAGNDSTCEACFALRCEPHWDNAIGQPGMNHNVYSLAVFDDGSGSGPSLYAGGSFATAGGVTVNNIAKWDGVSWSALGSGMNGVVQALTVFDDGSGSGPALYAGGGFTTAGGVTVNRIARWDGESWTTLGTGTNGGVWALTVFDDGSGAGPALYAGGGFTTAGGVSASRIARWDGESWSALGTGLGFPWPSLYALTVFNDGSGAGPALYAGGDFLAAGGVSANYIAKWDGVSWSALGSGMNGNVNALKAFDNGSSGPALYAGGNFSVAGGVTVNRIARWDGESWSALGSGTNASVNALTVFDDGSGAGPALYAGGPFTTAGGVSANRIARWDGESWSAFGSGMNNWVWALAMSQDGPGTGAALYAGGAFGSAGGQTANRIARWGGCPLCPPGEIADCNGNCAPASWVDDGYCDDGTYAWNGVPIYLNCSQFNNDGADCNPPPDPFPNPPNEGAPATPPYTDEMLDEVASRPGKNLVIIAHGWNTSNSTYMNTWVPFEQELKEAIEASGEWKVFAWNWVKDSGKWPNLNASQFGLISSASQAASNGFINGLALGRSIGKAGYEHVHLIGHSAGSALITAAAQEILNEAIVQGIPAPTIHATYLDAFVPAASLMGGMNMKQMYGAHADFAEHYYSKSAVYDLTSVFGATGIVLTNAFNVDITSAKGPIIPLFDPPYECGFGPICGHSWPIEFYRDTILGNVNCVFNNESMGFPLSKEILGTNWLPNVLELPPGANVALKQSEHCSEGGGAGGDPDSADEGPEMMPFVRLDALLDLTKLPAVVGPSGGVTIDASELMMSTSQGDSEAWVNFEIETTLPTNFLNVEIEFDPDERSGLLTFYFNGKRFGYADGRFLPAETGAMRYFFEDVAETGMHVISFRVDDLDGGPSTVTLRNLATGFGTYVKLGDVNGDGVVNIHDVLLILLHWGPCPVEGECIGDVNGDGQVNIHDILLVLLHWS